MPLALFYLYNSVQLNLHKLIVFSLLHTILIQCCGLGGASILDYIVYCVLGWVVTQRGNTARQIIYHFHYHQSFVHV